MKNPPNLQHEASCLLVEPFRIETTLNLALYSGPYVVGGSALIRGLRKALNSLCLCVCVCVWWQGVVKSIIPEGLGWHRALSSLPLLAAPHPALLAVDLNVSIFGNQGQIE